MTDWYTNSTPEEADRLLSAWPGAPIENAELCGFLLDVAREQVIAYAPPYAGVLLEESAQAWGLDPAPRLVYAQLQQAKNLWAAGQADESGSIGTEGYSFTPRPLDKTIRQIIRPTSGAADVL